MKRFDEILTPASWVVFFLGFLPLILVAFEPTAFELAIFLLVEYALLWFFRGIDRGFFLFCYPDAHPYFLNQSPAECGARSHERGVAVFESMVRFPRRRALYCALLSVPKVIPGILVIVFYWHHAGSNSAQFFKCLAVVSLTLSYFYGAVYIESHRFISRKIAEFHQALNWTDVFASVRIPYNKMDFKVQEAISAISILIFLVWLQYLVGTDVHPENLGQIGLREGLISFSGIALIARIWILEKFYLIGALESIFKNLEGFSPESSRPILALHSSPLLAGFERLFNTLLSKLGAYQKELSHWIQYQTEESRYQALGEISALTLHDISAPFQVIQFFTEKVRESPDCLKNPEYVRQLSENVDKAVKMIRSLRAHLADSAPGITSVDYGTSHLHVFQLLEAQFRDQGLENIRFTIDPALMTMRLKITKVDLIHVIFNLIKNSLENLLKNQVAAPRVSVSLQEHGTDYVVIEIQDNGTGLSSQRFEELTSIAYSGNAVRESMGLRLVRRVVERNKGTLSVKEGPDNGTHFHLRLFLALVDDQPNPPEEKSETKRFAAEPTDQMSGWGLPPAASDQPAPREEKSPKTGRGPQGT